MKKLRIAMPPTFYKWSWRLVPTTWVAVEWLAYNEEEDSHTWTAYTRPFIENEPLLKGSFILFMAWVAKHYLIDGGKK